MRDVIILHNSFENNNDLYLSQSGVMQQVDAVAGSLNRLGIGYTIIKVGDLKELVNLITDLSGCIIFNLVEEFDCDIAQACLVPAICKAFGASCTGSDTPSLLLAQNKFNAKSVLLSNGISCPSGIAADKDRPELIKNLAPGRYILKPALCDAGEGISTDSVVDLPAENKRAVELAVKLEKRFRMPVIVERYIACREFNVALMQRRNRVKVLAVAEIDFSAFPEDMPKIVDYNAKWQQDSFAFNNTPRKIPADITNTQYEQAARISMQAWQALGCRDYARVDLRMDEQGQMYVLEVNPNPDISPDSGFAAALRFANISFNRFVWNMINNAALRLENNNHRDIDRDCPYAM